MVPSDTQVVLDVPQKMFAAGMRKHVLLSAKDANALHDSCVRHGMDTGLYGDQPPPTLEETVRKCSAVLRDFGYAILRLHGEETGRICYMHVRIVRRSWDEALMSAEEKKNHKFFNKIAKKILDSDPEFRVSQMEAFHLADPAEMKLDQCKSVLEAFVEKGYLEYVDDWYSLGPYAMNQYDDTILASLPNAAKCDACTKILLRGFSCPNCPGKIHKYCYHSLAKTNKQALVCSQCRHAFPDFENETGAENGGLDH